MEEEKVLMQTFKSTRELLREWHKVTDIDMARLIDTAVKDSIWWREKHGGEIIIKKEDENGVS